MPTFICSSCDESFSQKNAYITYSKKCSSKATIHLAHTNQVIVLERIEGKFMCHCTDRGFPRPFNYANSLRCHVQKAGSRRIGPGIKGEPTAMEQSNLPISGGDQEAAPGPSRARMDSPPGEVRARLGSSRNKMDLVPGQKAAGPGPSKNKMNLDQESDTDESSDHDTRSWVGTKLISAMQQQSEQKPHQSSEEGDPMVEQDESMHSPTPVDPPTNMTSTPHPPPHHQQSPVCHLLETTNQANQLPSSSTSVSTMPTNHKTGLLHNTYMETLNLAVNAEFGFLTCQICQSAQAVNRVKHHLVNFHQTVQMHTPFQHHGTQASHTWTESPRWNGLQPVFTLIQHHPTLPRPTSWRSCEIQQLRRGAREAQALWEVEDVEEENHPMLHQFLVDSLLKELEPTLQVVQTPLDGHMVSPWLLTTQWHEHMAGKDIRQLCSLVTLPKNNDGDIPGLRDAVEACYAEVCSLLDRTGELVSQRLNSLDPTKSGISNTPFHKHLYKSTMKQYILPVVALLAMLIRQEYSGKDFTGSNNKLIELLAVLQIQDPEEGDRDALPLIHKLLFQVWGMAWTHQGDGDIVDPTERCLALMMLRQDGAFKEPQEVTPVIARLEYCMYLTFLKEIHQCMHLDPDSDELDHCLALESFFTEKTYLCKVFQETEAKLVQIWEEGILMGQDIRVEYDKIADDLVNKGVGYSFLSDARILN
ncbi:hypothetical protein EDD16DRAFT_1520180 [Pisolithus croceorrhizus]|nr:hypothetical protein EDD16DRAFT_1520180 [Pisolithus croceorrhizus]